MLSFPTYLLIYFLVDFLLYFLIYFLVINILKVFLSLAPPTDSC